MQKLLFATLLAFSLNAAASAVDEHPCMRAGKDANKDIDVFVENLSKLGGKLYGLDGKEIDFKTFKAQSLKKGNAIELNCKLGSDIPSTGEARIIKAK